MKFNAARLPFSLTLVGAAMIAALCGRRYYAAPYPFETLPADGMPLAERMIGFSEAHPVWCWVMVAMALVWTAYIIVQLTVRYASATSRNYLPITIFTVAAFGIAVPPGPLPSYIAALLLALATRQFISTFSKHYRFQASFLGGFYLGLIPLLYAPGIVLLPLIPALAALYRRSPRELTAALGGWVLPIGGGWFTTWAAGEGDWYIFTELWRCLSECHTPLALSGWNASTILAAAAAGMTAVLALMGIGWFVAFRKGMRTRQRKVMVHVSVTLFLLGASFALPGASLSGLPLVAVPTAMVIPYAFSGKQALPASILYFLIIATVFALNLLPLI